jgi:TfoX/Sxy family transcriptional regulator of competence genes
MAYDEQLAERVRATITGQASVDERKMFGGLAFLVGGNMCCGIVKDELMVRVGPEQYAEALGLPHAREIDFSGRPMTGMVMVATPGFSSDQALADWVDRGLRFASSLPAKASKAPKRRRAAAAG